MALWFLSELMLNKTNEIKREEQIYMCLIVGICITHMKNMFTSEITGGKTNFGKHFFVTHFLNRKW